MQALIEILKLSAALAFVGAVCYYWVNRGPTPRGRGRWHEVLDMLSQRRKKLGE